MANKNERTSINSEILMVDAGNIFYNDIVNHRKLSPVSFFSYIHKTYGSMDIINEMLRKMDRQVSLFKCKNIKTIISYKEACLSNNKDKILELKKEFDKIEDIEIPLVPIKISKTHAISSDKKKKETEKKIDDYINNENFGGIKLENLNDMVMRNINFIDTQKYIDFVIKRSKIEEMTSKDLEQIIEVLKYFIFNLQNNLYEIELYQYILSTRSQKLKSCSKKIESRQKQLEESCPVKKKKVLEEELKELNKESDALKNIVDLYTKKAISIGQDIDINEEYSLSVKCLQKISKIKSMLNVYKKILEDITKFKEALEIGNLKNIKFSYYDIKDSFIKEIITNFRNIIKGYNCILHASTNDKRLEQIKQDYLSKVYKI